MSTAGERCDSPCFSYVFPASVDVMVCMMPDHDEYSLAVSDFHKSYMWRKSFSFHAVSNFPWPRRTCSSASTRKGRLCTLADGHSGTLTSSQRKRCAI